MRSKTRRRILAFAIVLVTLLIVGAVGVLLALRPAMSDDEVQELRDHLAALSARPPAPPGTDVLPAMTRVVTAYNNFVVAFDRRSPIPWEDARFDALEPEPPEELKDFGAEDHEIWSVFDEEVEPVLAALEAIPDNPTFRFAGNLSTAPIPFLLETRHLLLLIQVRSLRLEGRGNPGAAFAAMLSVADLEVVRDTDTLIGIFVGNSLRVPMLETLRRLAPLPDVPGAELQRAIDQLAGLSIELSDLDRCLAREAISWLDWFDPDQPQIFELDDGYYLPSLYRFRPYLRHQRARFAVRWKRYFDLPRDNWSTMPDQSRTLTAKFRNRDDTWVPEIMGVSWYEPGDAVEKTAKMQTETVLTRVALAAELYRRRHGEHPSTLEDLAPILGEDVGTLPDPTAQLKLEVVEGKLTITALGTYLDDSLTLDR